MKIYVVNRYDCDCDGNDDSYAVAAFTTKEKADQFVESTQSGYVEEINVDPELPKTPDGMDRWCVFLTRRGGKLRWHTQKATRCSNFNVTGPGKFSPCAVEPYRLNIDPRWGTVSSLKFECWARDEAHAVEQANAKRKELIASGEWPPDVKVESQEPKLCWKL